MRKGFLLAIEGIDGAGKTTLASSIARVPGPSLAGPEAVTLTREPTSGPHGQRIRASVVTGRMSPQEELHAFLADRREHVAGVIRPALDRGEFVVVDRYFYSTVAYQAGRGFEVSDLLERNAFAPIPDLCLWLDVDPKVGLSRARSRGEGPNDFERLDTLTACRDVYRRLLPTCPEMLRVDANLPADVVFQRCLSLTRAWFLAPRRRTP